MNLIDIAQERMAKDESSLIVTILSGARQGDKVMYSYTGEVLYGNAIEGFTVPQRIEPQLFSVEDMECFLQPVEKDPEVLILGAGHVSRCVADQFLFIGCGVTVVDDRAEYLREDFFDSRVKRVHLDFKNLQERLNLRAYTGIVVVTRAHEFDSMCLHQVRYVLPTYVGVMGSHKRIYHAFEVLKEEGWTQEELDMLYGPIGLDLGAQTPEEIALSIVAEYVTVRYHKQGGFLSKKRYSHEA